MIVFLHIHKTGGTTFRSILEKNFGVAVCHTNQTRRELFCPADLGFVNKFFPRLRAITGHNLVDPLQFAVDDPFYATFLREPVARVISHYQDQVLRDKSQLTFEESLRINERLNNWQVKLMAGGENLDRAKRFLERCDFIGLTEKFNLSLQIFGKLAPCPMNLHYKRLTVAKNYNVQKALLADPRMLELAREHNRLDLELYQFALDEIFPKLCRKVGFNPADQAPSYEVATNEGQLNFRISRFYNKVWFRQVYKIRHRLFYPTDADLKPASS